MFTTTNEIYEFVRLAMKRSREHGYDDIAQQLDDALHLGSSGLEILGAIKVTVLSHRARLEELFDGATVLEVTQYVDRAYGIE